MKFASFLGVVALCSTLAACGHADDKPDPVPPVDADRARWRASVDRLLSHFVEGGQVVSRDVDGSGANLGDSLIWTGTALGVLGCDEGAGIARALIERLTAGGGVIERYDPLPTTYRGGNEVSLDGEIGLWLGFAARARRCPAEVPELARVWSLRRGAIAAAGGRLHPNVDVRVPVGLTAARDAVAAALGAGAGPSGAELEAFGVVVAGWARGVTASQAACFRINLAWTAARAIEEAGRSVPPGWRDAFCAATARADLPTVDHWCGRGGLDAYLEGYRPDVWEYRHQRCGGWETPDARELATPGLDELMALREKHGDAL